ncbi:MAG: hypothetical protein IMW92_12960 [Bacillales bacterium]|nr:hypothetical protein [Bacillales bacterium]
MFKDLSQGVKISITRSISTAFEQYMNKIAWSEEKFNMNDFVQEWRSYITSSSSWYDKVSEEKKADPVFHEELAAKINETISKILSEEPTEEQMKEIEHLQEQLGEEYNYSCKTEAKYLIEVLKEKIKKKQIG